jgi:hypothetical protein
VSTYVFTDDVSTSNVFLYVRLYVSICLSIIIVTDIVRIVLARIYQKKTPWCKGSRSTELLKRSEVTINLTRPLKKMQASEFFPLLYYIVKKNSGVPSPCVSTLYMLYNIALWCDCGMCVPVFRSSLVSCIVCVCLHGNGYCTCSTSSSCIRTYLIP